MVEHIFRTDLRLERVGEQLGMAVEQALVVLPPFSYIAEIMMSRKSLPTASPSS